MGSYPTADIIYGFTADEEDIIPRDANFEAKYSVYEWDKEFYKRLGKAYPGWSSDNSHPELKKAGCMVDTHGYREEPGEYMGIIDSHIHGDWDAAEVLDPLHFAKTPEVMAEWDKKLQDFCQLMGIKYREPKWLMLCSYG